MKETYFSKLHPALCFAFFIIAICLTTLAQHPAYLAVGLLGALCLNLSIFGRKALRRFAALLPLWIVLSAVNPLLNTLGAHVLFRYWGSPYTLEALCYGMVLSGMFVVMLQWFSAYSAVMTEDKFTYLFAALAPSIALLLTTVLRMIPNLMRKAGQIASARKCIGMGAAENAASKEKIREGMATLSVLTSWALEGGVVTADSMNSRGYGTGKRSCYHRYAIHAADIIVGALLAASALLTCTALFRGAGAANYTPQMAIAPITGKNSAGLIAYLVFLLTPSILNLKEEIQWSISRSRI